MTSKAIAIRFDELAKLDRAMIAARTIGLQRIVIRSLAQTDTDAAAVAAANETAMNAVNEELERRDLKLMNSFLNIELGYFDLHLEIAP